MAVSQVALLSMVKRHILNGMKSIIFNHLNLRAHLHRYNPIQKLGPQDCVSRINGIIDKFDSLLAANNTAAVQQFKEIFGLGDLLDNRDFAMTIAFPRRN